MQATTHLNIHIHAFMGKYAFPIILRGTVFIYPTSPHRLVLVTERRPALCEVGIVPIPVRNFNLNQFISNGRA
jgi:hypothetical protein